MKIRNYLKKLIRKNNCVLTSQKIRKNNLNISRQINFTPNIKRASFVKVGNTGAAIHNNSRCLVPDRIIKHKAKNFESFSKPVNYVLEDNFVESGFDEDMIYDYVERLIRDEFVNMEGFVG